MHYQDLYFKYKLKYLHLKYQLGGDEIEQFIQKIQPEDKEIVERAKLNFAKNLTELVDLVEKKIITMDILKKLFVNNKPTPGYLQGLDYLGLAQKGLKEIVNMTGNKNLFIYSFLVEYGFNRRPGQINDWIKRGIVLDNIIDILQEMLKGSTKLVHRYNRALYLAIMANSYTDTNIPLYPLDDPITKKSINYLSQQDLVLPELKEEKKLNKEIEFNGVKYKYKDIFNDYKLPFYEMRESKKNPGTQKEDIVNDHIADLAGLLSFAVLAKLEDPKDRQFEEFADEIRSLEPEKKTKRIDKAARNEVLGLEEKSKRTFLKTIH